MVQKSFLDILKYPMTMWFVFLLVAFLFGFTQYSSMSVQILIGNGAILLALIFGLWIGRRSAKAFEYIGVGITSALMLTVVIGFITTLFASLLSVVSQQFASSIAPLTTQSAVVQSIAIAGGITVWIEIVMIGTAAAAVAAEFTTRK